MRKARLIRALAVVPLFVSACWQIAACGLASVELADDMRDRSAQNCGCESDSTRPEWTGTCAAPSFAKPNNTQSTLHPGRCGTGERGDPKALEVCP